jgi:uncharacterized membrane protein YfcA
MSPFEIVLLIAIGMFSGSLNAIVGGGTFFTFPLLIGLGLSPIIANATNTVGLWPASMMAAHTYLPELRQARDKLLWRSAVALAGGVVGALLLLQTDEETFRALIPWLIGGATVLFTFSRQIVHRLSSLGTRANAALMLILELAFAVYGGYFGAGVGILLMAALALAGEHDPQVANAQKNLYGGLINGAAIAIFVVQGAVDWAYAAPLIVGAILGGYFGARLARLIPAPWLRRCVITMGVILTAIYFRDAYLG